jgi:hypothetical protein
MFGTELDADVGLGTHVMRSIMIGTTNLLDIHSYLWSRCR